MSDNKHTGRGFAGKGYYIALILCAAAIGITSYVYHRNSQKIEEVSLQETQVEDVLAGTMGTEDVPVLATEAPTQSTAPATQATAPTATEKKPLKTTSPVSGNAISGYSMEALSYNQTTRDWRVHNGVDLAAEPGAEVCAAADGKVYTVYEDDAMGHTVVIRHDDGYTTKYSSLSENVLVKAGDTVTMGQVIGYADDTAIVETTLGSHVHFSVTCNDEPMDPAEFLALGE
ncbi:MAG: peptidoglycan DD-metalloendopeptidase family protein [Faecousia sp.]